LFYYLQIWEMIIEVREAVDRDHPWKLTCSITVIKETDDG